MFLAVTISWWYWYTYKCYSWCWQLLLCFYHSLQLLNFLLLPPSCCHCCCWLCHRSWLQFAFVTSQQRTCTQMAGRCSKRMALSNTMILLTPQQFFSTTQQKSEMIVSLFPCWHHYVGPSPKFLSQLPVMWVPSTTTPSDPTLAASLALLQEKIFPSTELFFPTSVVEMDAQWWWQWVFWGERAKAILS